MMGHPKFNDIASHKALFTHVEKPCRVLLERAGDKDAEMRGGTMEIRNFITPDIGQNQPYTIFQVV